MADDVIPTISSKEIRTTRFAMNDVAAVGRRASADQGALTALTAGLKGTNTDAEFKEMYDMLVEIRLTLIALGIWKGSV